MSDFSSNAPDQSYWDWLKQQLGVKQDSFAMPQISPSGLPASYDERIKNDQSPDLLAYRGVPTAQGSAVTPAQASLLSQADQLGRGIQPASPMDMTPMSDYRGAGIQAPASQMDATPMSDYRGAGIQAPIPTAPASIASAPTTPAPTIPTATAPAPVDPTANYINSSVFGLGAKVDPNGVNPQTGLTNAQTQMMQYNMLGSVGSKLLAAGQNIMPAQRAQILGEIGNAASEPMTAMTQMQQRLLQNNKLARENAQQGNLAKIMQSPEFQQSFKDMSPQYQALAQAAAASGDINGVMGLIEKTQPRYANGMWIDPQKQTMTDPVTQITYGPNGVVQPTTQAIKDQISFDPKTYGLPEGTQARPMFTNMPDSSGYKSELAKVYSGEILPSQGRSGNSSKLQTDTMAAFPDYDPLLARNAYNINQQLTNHKAGALGAYKDSVGAMAGHFNELVDASKNLNNVSPMVWNSVKNKFETQTGGSAPVEFQNAANIYLSEVAKVLKSGGVPTDTDKSEIASNFNQAMSQGQLRGALTTMDKMARAKIASTDSSIQGDLQRLYNPDKHGLVNSYAQKQFEQADNNSWLHPEKAQTNQNTPLKPGKYKYNPQTGQMEPM
jgi:hypothetical protein